MRLCTAAAGLSRGGGREEVVRFDEGCRGQRTLALLGAGVNRSGRGRGSGCCSQRRCRHGSRRLRASLLQCVLDKLRALGFLGDLCGCSSRLLVDLLALLSGGSGGGGDARSGISLRSRVGRLLVRLMRCDGCRLHAVVHSGVRGRRRGLHPRGRGVCGAEATCETSDTPSCAEQACSCTAGREQLVRTFLCMRRLSNQRNYEQHSTSAPHYQTQRAIWQTSNGAYHGKRAITIVVVTICPIVAARPVVRVLQCELSHATCHLPSPLGCPPAPPESDGLCPSLHSCHPTALSVCRGCRPQARSGRAR